MDCDKCEEILFQSLLDLLYYPLVVKGVAVTVYMIYAPPSTVLHEQCITCCKCAVSMGALDSNCRRVVKKPVDPLASFNSRSVIVRKSVYDVY